MDVRSNLDCKIRFRKIAAGRMIVYMAGSYNNPLLTFSFEEDKFEKKWKGRLIMSTNFEKMAVLRTAA